MKLISIVDKNWAIGNRNKLLFNIPEDMKNFSRITKDSGVIIMGRKTFESIGKLLPDRINIILSKSGILYQPTEKESDIEYYVLPSVENLIDFLETHNLFDSACVIGGEQIYKQLIDYCNSAIITYVDAEVKEADTYFPNLDKLDNWNVVDQSDNKRWRDYYYTFKEYINFSGGKNDTAIKR